MKVFFSAFIIIPIIEMMLLIKVGSRIGALPTVVLVVLTALIGVTLIRWQGFNTLRRAQQRLWQRELPTQEILDGLCLAVAGALLLTPGFLTDTAGFALLVPSFRANLRLYLTGKWLHMPFTGKATAASEARQADAHSGRVLDAEFRRED